MLTRSSNFLKLWGGQTVSMIGSQITLLALPLTAVLMLEATPEEMGLLTALETLPYLLFSLVGGVWVDRVKRKPLLIGCDIGRAALLALVPISAWMGFLRIELLYIVGFIVGILTVLYDLSYQSVIPSVVPHEHIVEANSKLEASRSAAQIAGPAIGGWLVDVITAPFAIVVDAFSFLLSAGAVGLMELDEQSHAENQPKRNLAADLTVGFRVLLKNPILRTLVIGTSLLNLFGGVLTAVYTLYLTRDLALTPTLIGVVFAVIGPAALVGALLAERIAKWAGVGWAVIAAAILMGVGRGLIGLAGGAVFTIMAMLITAQIVDGVVSMTYNVNATSLRQTVTPRHLMGRVVGASRTIVFGTTPIGALIGGTLGGLVGLRITLLIAAAGMVFAGIFMLLSPVRGLQRISDITPITDEG